MAQGIGRSLTQKSYDQNCTVLAGMSKDFEMHLSLTLNFSYETETVRQINYRVLLAKGCNVSSFFFLSHIYQTQLPIRKLRSFNTFSYLYKKQVCIQ